MAKGSGESKLALAGVVTLAVALAGVLLVKEPLRSSRPVGTGLDVKQTTGEQSVLRGCGKIRSQRCSGVCEKLVPQQSGCPSPRPVS